MKMLISITLLIGMLSGCTGQNHTFDWKKPVALDMNPPEGPQNYQQGWSDGCKSGVASTNTSFHQFIGSYRFTLDNQLRYDALYNKAWKYGYNHCGYSMKSLAQYSF
jgi:hypothetical protein